MFSDDLLYPLIYFYIIYITKSRRLFCSKSRILRLSVPETEKNERTKERKEENEPHCSLFFSNTYLEIYSTCDGIDGKRGWKETSTFFSPEKSLQQKNIQGLQVIFFLYISCRYYIWHGKVFSSYIVRIFVVKHISFSYGSFLPLLVADRWID